MDFRKYIYCSNKSNQKESVILLQFILHNLIPYTFLSGLTQSQTTSVIVTAQLVQTEGGPRIILQVKSFFKTRWQIYFESENSVLTSVLVLKEIEIITKLLGTEIGYSF